MQTTPSAKAGALRSEPHRSAISVRARRIRCLGAPGPPAAVRPVAGAILPLGAGASIRGTVGAAFSLPGS